MALYKTEALILRSHKFQEADSLLTLLTKEKGKVKAIAKGVRKVNSRLRGGVQLFTHNELLLYQGRNLDIVTQGQCLDAFVSLQNNMVALAAACYWCELLDFFLPWEQRDETLFTLALAGFHLLGLENSQLVVRGLEVKLLSFLGFRPILEYCVSCGSVLSRGEKIFFSSSFGGVICAHCSPDDPLPFNWEALKTWQQLQQMSPRKFARLKISPGGLKILNNVLEKFLLYQLEYPLKSRSVFETMWQAEKGQKGVSGS